MADPVLKWSVYSSDPLRRSVAFHVGNACRPTVANRHPEQLSEQLLFVGDVGQQTNKACTHDSLADCSLIQCRGPSTATGQNSSLAINQSAKRLEVFVVDVDRTHDTARSELAAHLLFLEPGATLTEFLQI